jgi:Ca2+-binding RTX toxin-like protein
MTDNGFAYVKNRSLAICPGTGNDTANGGAGNDTFFLKDGLADTADGGIGADTATIDNGIDTTTNIEVIH